MKKYILIAMFFLLPLGVVTAATSATPSATATPIKNKQVEDLKERIATKVAQLSQTERRAIYGTVLTTSISTLTVETATKTMKIELTDDIKVFQMIKGKRTSLTVEDVSKNDVVSIFGTWDSAVEVLKAKVIFIHGSNEAVQRVIGTVTEAKKADYTILLNTKDGTSYTVDFETITKTNVWSKEKGLEKAGFSRLTAGDTLLVVGTEVPKKNNRISALRILDIGNLTGVTPAEVKEATVSAAKPTAVPTKKTTTTP